MTEDAKPVGVKMMSNHRRDHVSAVIQRFIAETAMVANEIPQLYDEAVNGADSQQWIEAISSEFDALINAITRGQ